MDRNSIIGFVLLMVLLVAYVMYNQHNQAEDQKHKLADSITYAKLHPRPLVDSSKAIAQKAASDSLNDSLRKSMPAGFTGKAQIVKLENKNLALQFTTKGAYPLSAQIKPYLTYDQKPLYLFNGAGNQLSAILPLNNGANATADLYYNAVVTDKPNGDKVADFTADLGNGKKVEITYTLPSDGYMVQYNMHFINMPVNNIPLVWQTKGLHTEKDITSERASAQVYYKYKNDEQDYFTIKNDGRKTLEHIAQWVAFRKQYFSTALIADSGFSKADIVSFNALGDSITAQVNETLEVPIKASNDESVTLRWYIGPNDYRILKSYKIGLDEMVPLGQGITAFVKYINRWIIVPIFFFIAGFVGNYGIIIIIMTLFIRLILSFFTYRSYLSAAKMRVLKPELDALRAKIGDDQQKFGVEQMKLFRSAGVNPLGGCLPTLFQMPILLSMYYLFPSFIEFRQQHFLWAKDLSVYDSIATLPFTIPWYGDHVSLFTLLMTGSSLFLALYNRNMTTQDPNNPMMKYMPYIFPFILIGVFNKMAAALTCYYTCSNLLSMTQQFIIQKYFINEKAIHAKLQENKNKPATPSKWAQKLEEIQKTQQEKMKTQPRINKK